MNGNKILSTFIISTLTIYSSCANPARVSPVVVPKSGDGICPSNDQIETELNSTKEEVKRVLTNLTGTPCGGVGWRRVAYLNMTDPTATCPSNWGTHSSPRGCGRTSFNPYSCDSVTYPVSGPSYSTVCGRILGYQRGTTDAFFNAVSNGRTSIDQSYVDGVSVTHGPVGRRQHIWTFAAAFYEQDPSYQTRWNCACTNTQYNWPYQIPAFVQNNYFCDTGNDGPGYSFTMYYPSDPLWDGAGCGSHNTCCQFNNPPWFRSNLPQMTTDNIELRICHGEGGYNEEDTVLYLIEIYVQ